jgi:hypothetical protein
VIFYPEEAERVVEKALTGEWHTLPPELELIGQEIANMSDGWSRNVSFNMLSYEEARKRDPRVDSWMLLAENAALSAYGFICEDGPEPPKEEGQEAAGPVFTETPCSDDPSWYCLSSNHVGRYWPRINIARAGTLPDRSFTSLQ